METCGGSGVFSPSHSRTHSDDNCWNGDSFLIVQWTLHLLSHAHTLKCSISTTANFLLMCNDSNLSFSLSRATICYTKTGLLLVGRSVGCMCYVLMQIRTYAFSYSARNDEWYSECVRQGYTAAECMNVRMLVCFIITKHLTHLPSRIANLSCSLFLSFFAILQWACHHHRNHPEWAFTKHTHEYGLNAFHLIALISFLSEKKAILFFFFSLSLHALSLSLSPFSWLRLLQLGAYAKSGIGSFLVI